MVLARYRRGRLLFFGAAMVFLAILLVFGGPLGLLMSLLLLVCSVGMFKTALGSSTALEARSDGILVQGQWTKRIIPWSEFAGVSVKTLTHYLFYIIPVSKTHTLHIESMGGFAGRNKKKAIALKVLDIGLHDIPGLVAKLDKYAGGGVVAQPVVPLAGANSGEPAFDADVAMRRYLTNKQATNNGVLEVPRCTDMGSNVAQQPVRASFGRKGL